MIVFKKHKISIINFLFAFLPISFIAGNLVINLNVLILIIISLLFYKKEIFQIKFNKLDKYLIFFFLILSFSSFYNFFFYYLPESSLYAYENLFKNLFFFRFLIIYFILRFLLENNILNLKFFFIFASMSSLFVALDVLLQFVTGKDIFGYENFNRRYPGPFGDEAISGSYLQRFSLFLFFLFPIFFQKFNKKKFTFLSFICFLIIFSATLISGNKFPFILFLASILILVFLLTESKKNILGLLFFLITVFFLFFSFNTKVKYNFTNFYSKIAQVEIYIKSFAYNYKTIDNIITPNTWIKEMHYGLLAFNTNKFFGGGIKSYKEICPKVGKHSCATHPHNYHIEVLVSTGLAGYLFLILIYLNLILRFIKKFTKIEKSNQALISLFFTLFFIEFFPLKTTGSIFSTTNATYFFIISAIAITLITQKIEKKT